MSLSRIRAVLVPLLAAAAIAASPSAYAKVDPVAARGTFKANNCSKCHSPTKSKRGPSLKQIAARYRDRSEGEQELITQLTTLHKVKRSDGIEDDHKVIDQRDAGRPKVMSNLAQWILSH